MKKGHGSSRRQAYGRRMKDLRTRQRAAMEIDLDGPDGWSRGEAWDEDRPLPNMSVSLDDSQSARR
jgi:hypothetical protein